MSQAAMADGDYVIAESIAAIAYLDRQHPEPPLFGSTPQETGTIWRFILDFDLYVSGAMVTQIIVPIVTGQAERSIDEARFCPVLAE